MSAWLPIQDAPRDGTMLLLLYPSGRVALGRWEHTVRTVNGKVRSDRADWSAESATFNIFADAGSAPNWFARIPAPPPRGEDGFISDPSPSEAPRCE